MPKHTYLTIDGIEQPTTTEITGKYKDMVGLLKWYFTNGFEAGWNAHASGLPYPVKFTNEIVNAKRNAAGEIGEILHVLVDAYIQKKDYSVSHFPLEAVTKAQKLFPRFQQWWDKRGLTTIATECSMVSEEYRYGGTVDFVGSDHNVYLIMDWKTSGDFYVEMLLQVAAYRQLILENMGTKPELAQIILIAKDRPRIGIYTIKPEHMDKAFPYFLTMRQLYGMADSIEAITQEIKDAVETYRYNS